MRPEERGSILVVDDLPANLKLLTTILKEEGYRVRGAPGGERALNAVEADPPELVLLDIRMPGMDGFQVCRKLKENPATATIPVLFISAMSDVEEKIRAFEAGGVDYITKPFETGEVLARVKTHLTLARLQKENLEQYEALKREMALRREQEELMIQQSKLAAMGEMLGNIAHQWRQPLNTVGILVQDLEDMQRFGELDETSLHETVEKVMAKIQHMSQTIDDFRNFFKPDKTKAPFLLNEAVKEAAAIIEGSLRNNGIRLEIEEEGDVEVNGFHREYDQVLINLFSNAKDALKAARPDDPWIKVFIGKTGEGRSLLTVTDNGGGMEAEVIDKVFDPFFSTRFMDEGTGIGLYMSKIIIEKNMGGSIRAENVFLPDAQGKEARCARFTVVV